jgi:hypothetical protein
MLTQFDKAFRNTHRVSPSQADTISLCERKWGFEKLDGIPKPPNEYAQVGLDCHEVLEEWQKTGKSIDLSTSVGKIVAPGLKFLPRPGTHLTEHDFVYDTGRVVFHGRMDLRGPADARVQSVWDHKTTGSFVWLKTPQRLRRDNQAVIYGKAAVEEAYEKGLRWGQTLDRVELNWVYYLRNPDRPRSRKVQLVVVYDENSAMPARPQDVRPEHFGVMTWAELEAQFAKIEQDIGIKILSYHWEKRSAADLPHNFTACGAYGGCPYQENVCTLTFAERIDAMEAQQQAKNISLSEKIRQNMGKVQGNQGAQEDQAQTTPTPPTVSAADPIPPTTPPAQGNSSASAPEQPAGGTLSPPPGLAKLAGAQQPVQGQQQPAQGQQGQQPVQGQQQPAQGQQQPTAAVNPPEKSKGVDPDAPAQVLGAATAGVTRAEMSMRMAESLVKARVYSVDDNRYERKIADQSVKLTDYIFAALSAK